LSAQKIGQFLHCFYHVNSFPSNNCCGNFGWVPPYRRFGVLLLVSVS
jgi:hypothetical protein